MYGFNGRLSEFFPSQLMVDITEVCNLGCIHCPHPSFKVSDHYSKAMLDVNLNKKAVDQIRALADSFQNQEINEIIINAYHDDTSRQRLLAENRSMAIKDLLVTFGVNEFQIQRNLPYGNEGDQLYFVYLRTVK